MLIGHCRWELWKTIGKLIEDLYSGHLRTALDFEHAYNDTVS